jgi:hypothetical protein
MAGLSPVLLWALDMSPAPIFLSMNLPLTRESIGKEIIEGFGNFDRFENTIGKVVQ